MGHVLQWDGCATGWARVRELRNPAIRSVSWALKKCDLRPGDRPIHGRSKHGPRPLVSDSDQFSRWHSDDVFGSRRKWKYEFNCGNLHGGLWLDYSLRVSVHPAALSADASDSQWKGLLFRFIDKLPLF